MKTKYILFLMICLISSGCVSSRFSEETASITLNLPVETATLVPTITPTSTVTQLSSPTIIPPTSTSTSTPKPTTTSTLPPTIEPVVSEEILASLLREAKDCPAPCFLGIVSGKTTLQEATNIITHLGQKIEKTNSRENKDFYAMTYEFKSGISLTIIFTVKDQVIENLRVKITPETPKEGVPREWSAYSPETLISKYGQPSSVHFSMDWGPRSFFDMVMVFDQVDLIVEYSGYDLIPRKKGSPKICPLSAQFESIRIWMGKKPVYPPAAGVLLEEATSLTMEEFSELMTGDPGKACLIVNGDVFP